MQKLSPAIYTAAQIAAALRVTKRGVLQALRNTPPDAAVIVMGNAADAWSFCSLPERLRGRLVIAAQRGGYRDPEHLLATPHNGWKPAVPLNQVSEANLDKAAKLMRALAPTFERMGNLILSESEFDRMGVEDYRREFGFTISARHWRRLLSRTQDRRIQIAQS